MGNLYPDRAIRYAGLDMDALRRRRAKNKQARKTRRLQRLAEKRGK